MKLLLVIDSLGSGGAQRQFTILATALRARGHSVDVFDYHPRHDFYRSTLVAASVRLIESQKRHRLDPGPMFTLRRLLRTEKYDACVAFLRSPSLYLLAARGIRRQPPIAVSERSSSPTERLSRLVRVIFRLFFLANAIVPNSNLAGRQMAAAFPKLTPKIFIIPNGVDLTQFPMTPPIWDGGGRPFRFLVAARMGPEKNALTIIEALALLRERRLPLPHITWVGATDPSETGQAYAAAVDARIHALGLEAQWTRLSRRDDIPALLAQHDAGLLASIYEGTPNFVCEALASGRPVIGSAVGDIPMLLEESGAGMLFQPLDCAALADAIAKFQSLEAADYGEMSRAARNFVERNLSAERYVMQWEELIDRMILGSQRKFKQRP